MRKYIKLFDNHSQYENFVNSDAMLFPNVSHCINENDTHYNPIPHDYSKDYLTFISLEDGNEISWYCGEYEVVPITYSTDNGNTWETYTAESSGTSQLLATINKDEKILFKENTAKYVYGASFISSKQLNIEGNIMSLVYGDDFANNDTTPNDFRLSGLFQTSNGVYQHSLYVVDASNLILPLETLTENCYEYMFYGCTSLTVAPKLLATTLAERCYYQMFSGCTSLTAAPELPATILADYCYQNMFQGCTSLTTAPALPVTTLTQYCYWGMFAGCTSLTTAPQLPATILANYCYESMFEGCTSLTTAPQLPATKLVYSCYKGMFYGCSSLNSITCLATDNTARLCIDSWVYGVASTGTFVKAPSMNNWATGIGGIPEGWTVQTATE